MGKTQSKAISQSGDPQVTVIQNQEVHTQMHEDHEIKLWIILALLCILVLFKIQSVYKKRERKTAIKAARSVAALSDV